MHRARLARLVQAIACALALPSIAAGAAADAQVSDAEVAQRLLRASGVGAELAVIAPLAASWLDGHDSPGELADDLTGPRMPGSTDAMPPADRVALHAIVEQGFDAAVLAREVRAALLHRLDAAKARAALRWLERPEVAALHAAGRVPARSCDASESPEELPGVREDARGDPARAVLEARVASATSSVLRSRRHASRVYAALLRAGNALLPEMQRFTHIQLADMIALHDAHLRQRPDAADRTCRYRDVSTETLASASRFLEGETGRWLSRSLSEAVAEVLDRAAAATALHIVETFGLPRPTPLRVAGANSP